MKYMIEEPEKSGTPMDTFWELDEAEWKDFGAFLGITSFNTNKLLCNFHAALAQWKLKGDKKYDENEIYLAVSGKNMGGDKGKWYKLTYNMMEALRNFLSAAHLVKGDTFIKQRVLATYYRSKAEEKEFFKALKTAKSLDELTEKVHYLSLFDEFWVKHNLLFNEFSPKLTPGFYQEMIEAATHFNESSLLVIKRIWAEWLSLSGQIKPDAKTEDMGLKVIGTIAKVPYQGNNRSLLLFDLAIFLFESPVDNAKYDEFRNAVFYDISNSLTLNMRSIFFGYLTSISRLRGLINNSTHYKLELYEEAYGAPSQFLLVKVGVNSVGHLLNYSSLLASAKKSDKLKAFLETHKARLEDIDQGCALTIVQAYLDFSEGRYEKVYADLSKASGPLFSKFEYKMRIYPLEIRNCYELCEIKPKYYKGMLEDKIANFLAFLKRNNDVNASVKDTYRNFIKAVKILLRGKSKKGAHINRQKLIDELNQIGHMAGQDWVMEKAHQ